MEGALQICTTHFSPWIRSVLDLLNFTPKKDWSLSNRAGLNGESWKGAVCKLDWDVLFLQTLRCFWSLNSIEMFWWFNASWLPMPQMFTLFTLLQKNSGHDLDLFPQAWRSLRQRERLVSRRFWWIFRGKKNKEHVFHGENRVKWIDFNRFSGSVLKLSHKK